MKPAITVWGRTDTPYNPTVRCDEWGTPRSRGTVCDRGPPRIQLWEDVRETTPLGSPAVRVRPGAAALIALVAVVGLVKRAPVGRFQ